MFSRITLALAFLLTTTVADAQIKFGAVGDSLTDEHFDQTEVGINLGYSKNWLELLVDAGQVDAGPIGNWGGTRGAGFEYNWALAGATTGSLVATNQHTNLANQISTAGITKAVLIVGSNDLFPEIPTFNTFGVAGSNYEALYEGLVPQATIDDIAANAIADIVAAAQTISATGVDLVVATAPDYGISPLAKTLYPNPTKRNLVDNVLQFWNDAAATQLTNDLNVPVVDIYGLSKDIWGDHGSENSTFQLGGVDLDLDGTGGVPYSSVLTGTFDPNAVTSDTADVFVHDGIHPNSTIGGIVANLALTAFNQEYGDSFTLFSEQEILSNAGPTLGSQYTSDTLVSSLGGNTLASYIIPAASTNERGDIDGDGNINGDDLDEFMGFFGQPASANPALDLDDDDTITLDDHDLLITDLIEATGGPGSFVGDINLDGDVDVSEIVIGAGGVQNFGDASVLLANLGTTSGAGFAQGDLNADGDVDVSQILFADGQVLNVGDASRLLANLGQSNAAGSVASNAVPEPGSMGMIILTGLCVVVRNRHRVGACA